MGFFESIIGKLLFNLLWDGIKRVGALIRWPFLYKSRTIDEIFKQKWSGAVGALVLVAIITLALLLVL